MQPTKRSAQHTDDHSARQRATLAPAAGRALSWLPLAFAAGLALLSLTDRAQSNGAVVRSFLAAAGLLVAWHVTLLVHSRVTRSPVARPVVARSVDEHSVDEHSVDEHSVDEHSAGERSTEEPRSSPGVDIALRPQHYIQAAVQIALLAYWGWYWRPVYDMSVLIAAQLTFAYGFGILLAWTRGRRYTIGFGPFPIILSINLFIWFRDDWFYLQFLMIAVGFLGKEFIRWQRDGRHVHVFNPSAFALGLFSLVLIATGTTDLTWAPEIASTLTLAPRIYTFLFATGLVVMYFFSITLVAGTAAAVLFGLSAAYSAWSGVPYFIDSEIPAAVFLGLHLLITDPSTSPRTPFGKAIFGALYGVGVFGLYTILANAGAPTFYDKLLCVPLLNLSVRGIDHFVRSLGTRGVAIPGLVSGLESGVVSGLDPGVVSRLDSGVVSGVLPSQPGRPGLKKWNLAHMGVWIVFFGAMTASGRTDGMHTGDSLPFWEGACAEGRSNACQRLLQIERSYCGDASAWACNELGIHYSVGRITAADTALRDGYFARACELRFQAACLNLLDPQLNARSSPRTLDLRLLLREGGLNLMTMSEPELYERACMHEWAFACAATGSTDSSTGEAGSPGVP
jgi:hypothetical protein